MRTITLVLLLFGLVSASQAEDGAWTKIKMKPVLQFDYEKQTYAAANGVGYNDIQIINDTVCLITKRFDGVFRYASILNNKLIKKPAEPLTSVEEYAQGDIDSDNTLRNYQLSYLKYKDEFVFRGRNFFDINTKKMRTIDSLYIPDKDTTIGLKGCANSFITNDTILWTFMKSENNWGSVGDEFRYYIAKCTDGKRYEVVHEFVAVRRSEFMDPFPVAVKLAERDYFIILSDSLVRFDGIDSFVGVSDSEMPKKNDDGMSHFKSVMYRPDGAVVLMSENNKLLIFKDGKWAADTTLMDRSKYTGVGNKPAVTPMKYDEECNLWILEITNSKILYKLMPSGQLLSYPLPATYFLGIPNNPYEITKAMDGKLYMHDFGAKNFVIFDEAKAVSGITDSEIAAIPNLDIMNLYPNPSITSTKVEFYVHEKCAGELKAELFRLNGVKVKDLNKDIQWCDSGSGGVIEIKTTDIESGIYFVVISISGEKYSKGLLIQK